MNLPDVIKDLITAQNTADSATFANCFTTEAKVFDEGNTYTGKIEIEAWVAQTTTEYNTKMSPISFEGNDKKGFLKTEISGTFPGSPLLFTYNFEFDSGRIQSLKIIL